MSFWEDPATTAILGGITRAAVLRLARAVPGTTAAGVTDVLPKVLARTDADVVYACGPMAMLQAVADARLTALELAAAENLRLSERRYEVGLADSIEVADAQGADVAARVGLATAGYRLETLTLRLRNALGRELFTAPEPAAPVR